MIPSKGDETEWVGTTRAVSFIWTLASIDMYRGEPVAARQAKSDFVSYPFSLPSFFTCKHYGCRCVCDALSNNARQQAGISYLHFFPEAAIEHSRALAIEGPDNASLPNVVHSEDVAIVEREEC